jgi:hypothetical protein
LFLVGLLLVIADLSDVHAALLSTNYPYVLLVSNFQAQPAQGAFFLWWNWEVFALGFCGYICFGLGAVALSNPLTGKKQKFKSPNINTVLLHLMVAGTAGFFTVVLESHQELSSLLTGGAYLVLITSFGPDVLKIHKGS